MTPNSDYKTDSYKVFALGGSTMWGTGAPDWGTIPAYLQAGLSALRHRPVCVVNFGESGFVQTQSVIRLLTQLQSGNIPDLVIFYDGINDTYAAYQSGQAVHQNLDQIVARFEREERPPSLARWLRTSYSFVLAKGLARKLGLYGSPPRKIINYESLGMDAATVSKSVVQTYLGNYSIVTALARQYGFKAVFFWQPIISIDRKVLTTEEYEMMRGMEPALNRLYDFVYRAIKLKAPEYENLYYMGDIFREETQQIWLDSMHLTPIGNQLIAQKMLEEIRTRGLEARR